MSSIYALELGSVFPDKENVYKSQGIPIDVTPVDSIELLYESALKLFVDSAQPKFILGETSLSEFEPIFEGEGKNADDAVPGNLYQQADSLALFALTMGERVSQAISHLMETNDFALGAMLDAIASNAADKASKFCEQWYRVNLKTTALASDRNAVLSYSPGYCGWHISSQRKLFNFLKPEKIGISLNDSYLMTPLKSISGVLVNAEINVHLFRNSYGYCRDCKNPSCLDRMKTLRSIRNACKTGDDDGVA